MAETREPGHAATLAAEAARARVPLVVAVGGDGTLNEVVNGVAPLREEYPVTVGALMTGRGGATPVGTWAWLEILSKRRAAW